MRPSRQSVDPGAVPFGTPSDEVLVNDMSRSHELVNEELNRRTEAMKGKRENRGSAEQVTVVPSGDLSNRADLNECREVGLFHPYHSPSRQFLDIVLVWVFIYELVAAPLAVSFLQGGIDLSYWTVDLLIDSLFFLDLLLNFRTAVFEEVQVSKKSIGCGPRALAAPATATGVTPQGAGNSSPAGRRGPARGRRVRLPAAVFQSLQRHLVPAPGTARRPGVRTVDHPGVRTVVRSSRNGSGGGVKEESLCAAAVDRLVQVRPCEEGPLCTQDCVGA